MLGNSFIAHARFAACAVAAFAVGLNLRAAGEAAPEKEIFAKHREWRLVGVEVPDADLKQPSQVADPLHGPWLTLPREDAMSVSWIAPCPCGGGVEYRAKGSGS